MNFNFRVAGALRRRARTGGWARWRSSPTSAPPADSGWGRSSSSEPSRSWVKGECCVTSCGVIRIWCLERMSSATWTWPWPPGLSSPSLCRCQVQLISYDTVMRNKQYAHFMRMQLLHLTKDIVHISVKYLLDQFSFLKVTKPSGIS